VEAKEPLTADLGAPVAGRIAGGQAMTAQAATEQYRRQQEELERQREMIEKSKDFTFINMMLKAIGMGEKK